MEILKDALVVGLTLYLPKEKTLVIGDVHLGYEDAMNRQGIFIPRLSAKEIMESLEVALKKTKPQTVVLLGDLKHEFGRISDQEWADTLRFIDLIKKTVKNVYLLKGNHDTMLEPIAKKRELKVVQHLNIGDFFFCHGDKLFDDHPDFMRAKTIVIGHEHPAIGIRDGLRSEKFKCFLVGKYKRKNLIVLPSFNPITEGSDVLQERLLSPFIKDIDSFDAVVISDKAYDFGKIKKLRKLRI